MPFVFVFFKFLQKSALLIKLSEGRFFVGSQKMDLLNRVNNA